MYTVIKGGEAVYSSDILDYVISAALVMLQSCRMKEVLTIWNGNKIIGLVAYGIPYTNL